MIRLSEWLRLQWRCLRAQFSPRRRRSGRVVRIHIALAEPRRWEVIAEDRMFTEERNLNE